MKRRDFLKLLGVAIAAPTSVLGAAKAKPERETAFPSHPGCINPAFTGAIGVWDGVTIREDARREYYEWNRKIMDEEFVAALNGLTSNKKMRIF